MLTQIMADVRRHLPDAAYVIAGGYRRGKPLSGDVDIVMTGRGLTANTSDILHALVDEWYRAGRVTHTVSLSRPAPGHRGGPGVAELVYVPRSSRIRRRVDLVLSSPAQYGAAVLAWTGSVLHERDLRRWARTKGYQFSHAGLVRLEDGVCVSTPTEESVYAIATDLSLELLELPYLPPTLRNAD